MSILADFLAITEDYKVIYETGKIFFCSSRADPYNIVVWEVDVDDDLVITFRKVKAEKAYCLILQYGKEISTCMI